MKNKEDERLGINYLKQRKDVISIIKHYTLCVNEFILYVKRYYMKFSLNEKYIKVQQYFNKIKFNSNYHRKNRHYFCGRYSNYLD